MQAPRGGQRPPIAGGGGGGKLVAQSCRTLCDPMDGSPPGFSVYAVLEWVVIPFSIFPTQGPRDRTPVFCIAGGLYHLSHQGEKPIGTPGALGCWRRKWQPTPVFLPGESQGRRSLVTCRLWGRRVGQD